MYERFAHLLFLALLLLAATLVAFLSTRFSFETDVSYAKRSSLSEASIQLLKTMEAPVEVISYAQRDGEVRAVIADFIQRYRRVKPDLTLRFIDPDADPGAMRAQGVQVNGELEIHYGDRNERLKVLSEAEFSNALLRLTRIEERMVAFLEGEGERQAQGKANADLGQFMALLGEQGVRSVPLPLANMGKVPENTALLVIANPQVKLSPANVAVLVDYVERGGNLLWLTEPNEQAGLEPLADALSIRVLAGTVVDGGGQAFGISDPSFVALSHYPEHAITHDFALSALFPQPAALAQLANPRWRLQSLLQSSDKSWNETGHIPKAGEPEGAVRFDASEGEISGPLDLGFALSRLSPRPDRQEQRVVVIGDGDFLSNSFLGNGGNRELGQRVFNWLLNDDALITIPERTAPDRELKISQNILSVMSLVFLLGIPLLLVTIAGFIRWQRRKHA